MSVKPARSPIDARDGSHAQRVRRQRAHDWQHICWTSGHDGARARMPETGHLMSTRSLLLPSRSPWPHP